MNGYKVHKRFERLKRAENLYLKLDDNVNRTLHDIFLKNPTDKYNKKINLQAKILFDLRGKFLKNCFTKES